MGQSIEQFERCEAKLLLPMHIGLGSPDRPSESRRRECPGAGGDVEPLQSRSVMSLDEERSVHGEPAGPLSDPPSACARHVRRGGGGQAATPGEPSQDPKLHRACDGLRLSGLEPGGLGKPDSALQFAGDHAFPINLVPSLPSCP
jgi:hypothetical protein